MADRQAKLRRLNDFRRSKAHCSASALSQILTDIKSHGLPDLVNRNTLREARDFIASACGTYGPIVKLMECEDTDGTFKQIPIACPFASLSAAMAESINFQRFVKGRLQKHPCTPDQPWNIVIYSDEVTPGNPLQTMNKRKFQSFYWTFLEFGASALSREESWFVLMTEFSTTVNSLPGGLSQVFGSAIKTFFQPDGFHMLDGGINLDIDGEHLRLFAKLGVVLQDGGAHKAVWQARGDGASRFCLLCKNIFTDVSNLVEEDGTRTLRCNQIKLDELEASTDRELRINARFLEQMSGTVGVDEFTRIQQAVGLTYAPHGILVDRSLDRLIQPTDVYMHDYMHALFVDGVLNLVIYLCFEQFIQAGQTGVYESFSEFLSHWKFPGRLHADHLSDIFAGDRRDKHRKAKHIKCQASDMLSVIGVLSLYVRTVLIALNIEKPACDALLSAIDMSLLIVATGRITVSPAKLLGFVHRFLRDFTVAFGFEWLTPKCHWLLHLPETLGRFGRLLNCFALERKHRVPKRYATDLSNTSRAASKSLLSEVVCHHLGSMKEHDFIYEVGLIRGRPAPKKSRRLILEALEMEDDGCEILTALEARFSPLALCRQHDVVLLQDGDSLRAARVHLHCMVAGECVSLLETFTLIRRRPGSALSVWRVNDEPHECWETKAIVAAVEFCVYPDGNLGTFLPIEFVI